MHKKWYIGIFSFAVCYLAAFIGSIFTTASIPTWYVYLHKPVFSPPNWVFAPVWSLLYTLMGYALFLIIVSKPQKYKERAFVLFTLQLILNVLWSLVFFGLHFPGIAFIVIVCLWISIFKTIYIFRYISVRAAMLLIPYLCWVSFAAVLNMSIVLLN